VTLTKGDIIQSVMEKVRTKKPKKERERFLFPEFGYETLPRRRAAELVDATFEIIKKTLEKGDHILISGFGKFKVRFKWARKGRNPRTGEPIILDSKRTVAFQCSPKLKAKIQKGTPE
jgi:integration host factor subunit alpha